MGPLISQVYDHRWSRGWRVCVPSSEWDKGGEEDCSGAGFPSHSLHLPDSQLLFPDPLILAPWINRVTWKWVLLGTPTLYQQRAVGWLQDADMTLTQRHLVAVYSARGGISSYPWLPGDVFLGRASGLKRTVPVGQGLSWHPWRNRSERCGPWGAGGRAGRDKVVV